MLTLMLFLLEWVRPSLLVGNMEQRGVCTEESDVTQACGNSNTRVTLKR